MLDNVEVVEGHVQNGAEREQERGERGNHPEALMTRRATAEASSGRETNEKHLDALEQLCCTA